MKAEGSFTPPSFEMLRAMFVVHLDNTQRGPSMRVLRQRVKTCVDWSGA